MEYTGIRFFNSLYVRTPEAIFKIAELMFGAGAWGTIIVQPVYSSGPYSFFLWSTFGSWILVLLTYLLGLCKLSKFSMGKDEWRKYCAPDLGDLCLNAAIAVTYIPSVVVFGVYSFPAFGRSSPVFVIIMAVFAFAIHACHASTLALYFMLGAKKWKTEKRWIWQKSTVAAKTSKPAKKSHPSNYEQGDVTRPGGYEEPIPTGETAPADAHHEIYQDVN